ncbi:MAG: DUF2470 domain-containing protein [Granulosicoccus sp.]|nr:DUF2470 domain-containing protein [Granulosicoccus sp.]
MSERQPTKFDTVTVDRIVSHMNEDHSDALYLYLSAFSNVRVDENDGVEMLDIDEEGISIRFKADAEFTEVKIRFADTIGKSVVDPSQARKALVDMVGIARNKNT